MSASSLGELRDDGLNLPWTGRMRRNAHKVAKNNLILEADSDWLKISSLEKQDTPGL